MSKTANKKQKSIEAGSNDKTIMTCKDVANYLGMNYYTIVRYANTGKLPAIKVGRSWIFHKEALDKYLINVSQKNVKYSKGVKT